MARLTRSGVFGCVEKNSIRCASDARELCFELGLGVERGEKIRLRVRVVARARERAHAKKVGLVFLLAREARKVKRAADIEEIGGDRAAGHGAHDGAYDAGADRAIIALGGVARRDMADLVSENARHFRLAVGKREKAARDVDIAAGQREGVDDGRVEKRDGVAHARIVRVGGDAAADLGDIAAQGGIRIDAIALEDFRVLLRADLLFLRLGHEDLRIRRGRGGGEKESRHQDERTKPLHILEPQVLAAPVTLRGHGFLHRASFSPPSRQVFDRFGMGRSRSWGRSIAR